MHWQLELDSESELPHWQLESKLASPSRTRGAPLCPLAAQRSLVRTGQAHLRLAEPEGPLALRAPGHEGHWQAKGAPSREPLAADQKAPIGQRQPESDTAITDTMA